MKYCFLLFVGLIMASCSESVTEGAPITEQESSDDLLSYFYPEASEDPKIYVYTDSLNPLAEQIERVYHLDEKETKQLVIEKYTSTLRIKEAYSLKLEDSLKFFDHMIVDRTAKKRKAKVVADRYFPLMKTDQPKFVSHFPGVLDSTIMINDIRSRFVKGPFSMKVLGEDLDVILIRDSISWTQLNPATDLGNTSSGVVNKYYAKNVGLVAYATEDGSLTYNLTKILSEMEWQSIVNP